ncbi:MAG: hypothetical protein WCS43_19140, partial [Verrucomicrobiota bacterium]
ARPNEVKSLDDFLGRYFQVTEEIQSSPSAASVSAYQVVAKAYRRAEVSAVELRFNPHKRMRHGLHTMDAIILAVMQGLERASLHYGVATGIILSLGRDLSLEANWQIIDAAIKWRSRGSLNGANGVVGIDMAGPESRSLELSKPWMSEVAVMMEKARAAGLKITYHVGESEATGPEGMLRVIEAIHPDRIGHGIELRNAKGKKRDALIALLRDEKICLELCPTVNLVTRVIPDFPCIARFVKDLADSDIPYCINTDNPYLIHTNLKQEYEIIGNELKEDAKPLLDLSMQHAIDHRFINDSKHS